MTIPALSRPREPSIEESFFLQHRGRTRCRLEGSYPSEEPVTIRKLGRFRPPHSASASQRRTSIARGSVARTQAPVHPDTRTCLELLWALAVTETSRSAAARPRLGSSTSATDFNATHGHCFPWARSSRDEGGCPSCVATPGCAFAPLLLPFAEAKQRRVLQRATSISPTLDLATEPSPPNTETRYPASSGAAT